jgi:1,4-alpha-glucan branching enzyme
MSDPAASLESVLAGEAESRDALRRGHHCDPHVYLGPHAAEVDGEGGTVVRVYHPGASAAALRLGVGAHGVRPRVGTSFEDVAMTPVGGGVFAVWLAGREGGLDYRLRYTSADGSAWERHDPYRFLPTVGELDLYLFAEGTHRRLWECLGARPATLDGVAGYAFAVWAANARRVSVVGDFCHWDGRLLPMRRLGRSGVFELFVPELEAGTVYKYEVLGEDDRIRLKADPLAREAERPPATGSRLARSTYAWGDGEWMASRTRRDVRRSPLATYEVHLGSWKRDAGAPLSYRRLADELVPHVVELGFDSLELLPIADHPFDGSWGYQVAGYYAPTALYGAADDLRHFVDRCHQAGLAVIVDWVPGHFVKDAHGLGRFDGTALYEHEDPRLGVHPDWDTYVFNHGRHEVKSFLVSNALYWLEQFHVDGLRVDAVASMLYRDYSRKEGEWIPNRHGGRENLEAIDLLRQVNQAIHEGAPGCFTIAEESTAWPQVTGEAAAGGLGFDLKWNMGWMHDTLSYFSVDPYFRAGNHDRLTFAMIYEFSERFVNPLSHDEVVHGKGSLYHKMPGDPWRKMANLRALYAYQFTRPGKVLLFMGSEIAPSREWNHTTGLDWYLLDDPSRAGLFRFVCALGKLYHQHPCLWISDPDPEGFKWIACHDREASVVAYERRRVEERKTKDADEHLVVVLNLTPVPREGYRLGAPRAGSYRLLLSSDAALFGGSGYAVPEEVTTDDEPWDGYPQSMRLTLPPLAALVLAPGKASKKAGTPAPEPPRPPLPGTPAPASPDPPRRPPAAPSPSARRRRSSRSASRRAGAPAARRPRARARR